MPPYAAERQRQQNFGSSIGGGATGATSATGGGTSTSNENSQQFSNSATQFQIHNRVAPSPTMHHRNAGARRIKCVFVGDGAIGKTSLIVSYTTNGYPQEYVPTAFDNYSVLVRVDNQPIQLQLCDTAGQDDFDSLRPLCYPHTDVFLLCFSVVNPTSFESLRNHWLPEIRRHSSPSNPCILIGTQSDLRTNVNVQLELAQYGETPVDPGEAKAFAKQIQALDYIECSALTQQNLKEVFDAAILAGLRIRTGGKNSSGGRDSTIFLQEFRGRKSFRRLKSKLTKSSSSASSKLTKSTSGASSARQSRTQSRTSQNSLKNRSLPASFRDWNQAGVPPNFDEEDDEGDFYDENRFEKRRSGGWRKLFCFA